MIVAQHEVLGKGLKTCPSRRGPSDFAMFFRLFWPKRRPKAVRLLSTLQVNCDFGPKGAPDAELFVSLGQFAQVKGQANQLPFGLNFLQAA
jgi:hypothetical protein